MPRADRSIALPTGMIIGALYVILLVSFSQESYMRRDAARRADGPGAWPAVNDVSKRVCRIDAALCTALFADAGERQSCDPSTDAVHRLAGEPMVPLTLDRIRRAMRELP